jgi:hypothetical protein
MGGGAPSNTRRGAKQSRRFGITALAGARRNVARALVSPEALAESTSWISKIGLAGGDTVLT